jgi:hypothetical protein
LRTQFGPNRETRPARATRQAFLKLAATHVSGAGGLSLF